METKILTIKQGDRAYIVLATVLEGISAENELVEKAGYVHGTIMMTTMAAGLVRSHWDPFSWRMMNGGYVLKEAHELLYEMQASGEYNALESGETLEIEKGRWQST